MECSSDEEDFGAGLGGSGAAKDDEELTLPRAAMNKMIKEKMPTIRVANEARELILQCATDFVHLVSSEANDVCEKRHQKKTISPEHVLEALDRLGFGDYRKEAEAVVAECRNVAAKRRRQSTRLENLGIPEEELLRQQQELFAKAREAQLLIEQQERMTSQQQQQQHQGELQYQQQPGAPVPPSDPSLC